MPMGSLLFYYYYQIYQLGTGRHTQKAQACMRCLPIAKETQKQRELIKQGTNHIQKKPTPRSDWNHRPPGYRPGATLGGQAC